MAATIDCIGMACDSGSCDFHPIRFKRRAVGDNDVHIDMKYSGVCHTDLTWVKNEAPLTAGTPAFPNAMPGHELAGVCIAVGKNVTKIKVGDQVGVGAMVDSCLACSKCKAGSENWCKNNLTTTYGGRDTHGRAGFIGGTQTQGGYCNEFVVHEHFAIKIPSTYPLEAAGPIMCAGITVYDPMKEYGVGPGSRVGVVGIGGLGLTAIKIAKVMGAAVTAISRSDAKRQLALDSGATSYIAMANAEQLEYAVGSLDLIINTVPANHDYTVYCPLLNDNGKQILLGLTAAQLAAFLLKDVTCGKCRIGLGAIGGIAATQELIDLADKYKIIPHTKICPVSELNKIYELYDSGNDAGIRYVLDIGNTLTEEAFDKISCGDAPELATAKHDSSIIGIGLEVLTMLWSQVLCKKRAATPDMYP